MARSIAPSPMVLRCLRSLTLNKSSPCCSRSFSTSSSLPQEQVQVESSPRPSFYRDPDPLTVLVPRLERRLRKAGTPPIGSKRRRAALIDTPKVAFEQLPFQCFQEARKVLQEDRAEKLKKIELERTRIVRLKDADPALSGGEQRKQLRLKSMQTTLEKLKILADINDPMIKKRFEDKMGDYNKPIYRYLAERRWRAQRRKIVVQRIHQMKVIPDVVDRFEPTADVTLYFKRLSEKYAVSPGEFLDSTKSERPVNLSVQVFERGEKLISIAVVDADVPDVAGDGFKRRCHFIAANIKITPTHSSVILNQLSKTEHIIKPWVPPTAQKGSPYHRVAIIVCEQKDNIPIEIEGAVKIWAKERNQDNFSVRKMLQVHSLKPVGVTMFRTKWDDSMAGVMQRHGIEGAEVELKRVKVEPLPYKRRTPSNSR